MKYIIIIVMVLTTSCSRVSLISKRDDFYSMYTKKSWSEKDWRKKENQIEAKKVMLECGYCTPFVECLNETSSSYGDHAYLDKTRFLPKQCMLQAGFVTKSPSYCYDGKGYIRGGTQTKPDTSRGPIPNRSVERRLNSQWCTQIFPESDVCKP